MSKIDNNQDWKVLFEIAKILDVYPKDLIKQKAL